MGGLSQGLGFCGRDGVEGEGREAGKVSGREVVGAERRAVGG